MQYIFSEVNNLSYLKNQQKKCLCKYIYMNLKANKNIIKKHFCILFSEYNINLIHLNDFVIYQNSIRINSIFHFDYKHFHSFCRKINWMKV